MGDIFDLLCRLDDSSRYTKEIDQGRGAEVAARWRAIADEMERDARATTKRVNRGLDAGGGE